LPRRSFLAIAAGAAVSRPFGARAQLNATRPIRIIVPFAPAGSSDVLARLLQSPLQQALGQTVIVENRAGAGANIGMVEAARRARRHHAPSYVQRAAGEPGAL
jgi:tripartite-type tricarboxylate transporter receptor subunit TctC